MPMIADAVHSGGLPQRGSLIVQNKPHFEFLNPDFAQNSEEQDVGSEMAPLFRTTSHSSIKAQTCSPPAVGRWYYDLPSTHFSFQRDSYSVFTTVSRSTFNTFLLLQRLPLCLHNSPSNKELNQFLSSACPYQSNPVHVGTSHLCKKKKTFFHHKDQAYEILKQPICIKHTSPSMLGLKYATAHRAYMQNLTANI